MSKCPYLSSIILSLLILACKGEQPNGSDSADHSLRITVDPRMELLSVVQILGDYGQRTSLISHYDFPYKEDVKKYFAPYKDHPAVKLFNELSSSSYSFRFSTPPTAMLYLSDPPDLRVQSKLPKAIFSLSGGKTRLEQFFESLRDFARTSNFTAFFEAHRDFYAKIVANAYGQLNGINVVAALEDYFGTPKGSYNIIIVPLQSGSFGIEKGDGRLYNVCGPDSLADGTPYLTGVRDICWHELGHSFVNPVVARYVPRLRRDSSLFDPIAGRMHCGGYDDFEGIICEHVLRAANVRMTSIYLGAEAADNAVRGHRSVGFVYVAALADKLKLYEARRDEYPTFEQFLPQMVDAFDELSQAHLGDSFYTVPFTGTIRSVFSDYNNVFIVPSRESDTQAQNAIMQYVKQMRDTYHKGSQVLTDVEALAKDLSHYSLMIFGTVDGNLWLDHYRDSLPFHLDGDKITVGKTPYPGNHLRLITAWPNPQNRSKGVTIYTAQEARDIAGCYDVPFWWADYVIVSGTKALYSGNYERAKR
jgi:hypothetical protein